MRVSIRRAALARSSACRAVRAPAPRELVATSLSMAPAMLIAQGAAFVDLDGPLLLAKDRQPGLSFIGSMIEPCGPEVWG